MKLSILEQQLIHKIQRGDDKAFEHLFKSYYPHLCRFANSYVKSSEISEDLVQDVFLKIWQNRNDWAPNGTIKSYLFKAVQNKVINLAKHRQIEKKWFDENRMNELNHKGDSPEDQLAKNELYQAIQNAINNLPDRCRKVFVLHRQGGLKYDEIAQVLSISPKTVEVQMGRALKIMRKLLGNHFTSS